MRDLGDAGYVVVPQAEVDAVRANAALLERVREHAYVGGQGAAYVRRWILREFESARKAAASESLDRAGSQEGEASGCTCSCHRTPRSEMGGDVSDLPVLKRDDVRMLYHSDFWDHPRSGALEWGGKRYWFEEAQWDSMVFDVLDLDAKSWAYEDEMHAAFREHVGDHCEVPPGPQKDWRGHHRFYDDPRWFPADERPEYTGTKVAVWKWEDEPS
jgi:hypothetical protein